MSLQLSSRSVATLVYRLCAPKLTPVAKAAHRHEKALKRVFLKAIREAQDAVPMGELESVLNIPGTGAPLYVLQPVFDMLLEQTEQREYAPYMRVAAAGDSVAKVLSATLADGAGANELCVVPSASPSFTKSLNREWRLQGQNDSGEAFDIAFITTGRLDFVDTTLAKASKVLGIDAEELSLRMTRVYSNIMQGEQGLVNIRMLGDSFVIRTRHEGAMISRKFSKDVATGALRVEHSHFELPSALQGKGIATRLLADSIRAYEAAGVQYIELTANLDVGGYAWGRLGYQASNPEAFKAAMLPKMRRLERFEELSDGITRAGKNAPEWLANQPEGKKIMLGTSWEAEMNLSSVEGRTFATRVQDKAKKGKGK